MFPCLIISLSSVFFSLSWHLKNWIVGWLIPRATGHSLCLLYNGFIRLFSTTAKNRRKSLIRTSPWEWYRVLLVKESVSVKTAAQCNYTRTFSSDVSVLTDVVPTKQNWGFNSGTLFFAKRLLLGRVVRTDSEVSCEGKACRDRAKRAWKVAAQCHSAQMGSWPTGLLTPWPLGLGRDFQNILQCGGHGGGFCLPSSRMFWDPIEM